MNPSNIKNLYISWISMVFDQLDYGLIITLRIFFISGTVGFSIGLRELIISKIIL
jgi:hypothetical protein